ncbi:MAG: PD40 domain-containing protein [Bacteroidetes bacterium]|nr:PD40 domain-containing protein [Bacteroidota bacterium]
MQKILKPFLILIFISQALNIFAQRKDELEQNAYDLLNYAQYAEAYTAFDQLSAKYPKNIDYKEKLGICCIRFAEKKDRAIEVFTELKSKTKNPLYDYYLGKAYHVNYKFDEAIPLLEGFLANINSFKPQDDFDYKKDAELTLKNCANGKELINNKVIANITNIGKPVNTEEDEYVPCITTDESIMFFTYRGKKSLGGKQNGKLEPDEKNGKYLEEVYVTYKLPDSTWAEPKSVTSVNTKGNDAAISVSPDGKLLFVYISDTKNPGDIYVSTLEGKEFTKPKPLNKNINSVDFWEGSCSISADGKSLYFASERPGGLGGRDIWVSQKIDGDWGEAKNMGPSINTPYDDDAPFIHPDGITLFFSSKGHQSIGGYDIMYTVKRDNEWLKPSSMGLPLNTTEDDRYYVINSKGDKGFFSSDRGGSGGLGGQDIYQVTPGILGDKPVIALLKGVIYGDDKPVQAKIEITKIIQKEKIDPITSDKEDGKYMLALSPGAVYNIKVSAEGFEPVSEDLDLENLDKYMESKKDFYLYSQAKLSNTLAANNNKTTENSTTNSADKTENTPCNTNVPLPDFSILKGKSLNNPEVYKQLIETAGNYCAKKLIFKVQIAAYRHPKNYNYSHLTQYGKPEIVDYPDGITRFTQLQFNTIKEAEAQRQKAIAKGQTDAWIVAFVEGKRYTLEELIMLDFLGKSIN